ncbi:hypothetical protein D3C81_1071560 [compost metagenome]
MRRDVHQARVRVVRHRVPIVGTPERRGHQLALAVLPVARRLIVDDRPPGLHVDAFGPVHRHDVLRRQQLAGSTVQHIEEAVFRRLHQHFARFAVNGQLGQDHVLGGGEVPGVAWRGLVVPGVFAGVGIDRDDRGKEQVVALGLAAPFRVPHRAIAHADIQQVEFRVVGERIPGRTAAAPLDISVAVPGLAGDFHGFVLGRQLGVARHGEEAPGLFAGFGVIRSHVAAHTEFRAAIADDHLAVDHPRRPGDGVTALVVIAGVHRPHALAGLGVDRLQAAIEHSNVDLALPNRHASVDRVTTGLTGAVAVRLRVVLPQQRAIARVQGVHHRKRPGGVHHAVNHDRCCLHTTV